MVIAHSEKEVSANTFEVACKVPNEEWYFEIEPGNGWITWMQRLFWFLISIGIAFVSAIGKDCKAGE